MEFTQCSILLFLYIVTEFWLSFSSDPLRIILTCLYGLWSFLLFLCNLVWTSSLPPEWETKNIPQSRPKRRRKGGTQKGWRYYQRPQEDKNRLISIPNRTLGQHHDTMRPHQRMCPGSTRQASFEGDPTSNRTGCGSLFSPNLVTMVFSEGKAKKKSNLLSCKGKGKKKCSFPNHLGTNHQHNSPRKIVKHDSVVALPTWSSKDKGTELQGHQQPPHLEAWKIQLLEAFIRHFSAIPSFPSMPSPSVVIDSDHHSSPFLSNRIPHAHTHQVYPLPFHPITPSLPAFWPQPSPEILPQPQSLPPPQTLPQVHPQSPLQENGLSDQELSESEVSSSEDLVNDSEEEVTCDRLSHLGETSMMSQMLLRQRQIENVIKTYSSNEFEEIRAGGPPEPVCTAQHANQPASTLYVKPETIPKNRSQTPLVGGDDGQNTCQDMPIPGCSSQQMSHDTFNNIPGKMLENLPTQALDLMSRWEDSSSHSVSVLNSNLTTAMNINAEVDSQPGGFMPLRGSSPCLHGDNKERAYAASSLGHPLDASTFVNQEEQGDLSQSRSGTECQRAIIPVVLQDPQSSDLKEQLSQEIHCEMNNRKHSQARGQRSDTSLASDGLTSKASLHAEQPASIVDGRTSQVPQVHAEAPGVSVEQRQELRSHNIIRWCREKIFPNRKQIGNLQDPKLEKPGGVKTELGTSHVGEEDNSAQDAAPKEMLGSKSSETLPPKRQSLKKQTIRKKLFCCFQCLNPGNKKSQKKGRLGQSTRIRSSDKNRAVFTENKHEKCTGEPLHEKTEGRQLVTVLHSPVKSGKPQRTTQVGAQAGLPKGHYFILRAPGYQVTNTCQEESCTSAGKIRNKDRQAQKSTEFKEQISCESLPQSSPHTRLHDQQGPQAALITAFTVVSNFVRQKAVQENLKGKQFSTPK